MYQSYLICLLLMLLFYYVSFSFFLVAGNNDLFMPVLIVNIKVKEAPAIPAGIPVNLLVISFLSFISLLKYSFILFISFNLYLNIHFFNMLLTIWSFLLKSLGENKLVYSNNVLPLNI